MDEIINKQLIYLVELGLIIEDKNEMLRTLSSLQYIRYVPFIKLLKKWNIETTQSNLFIFYEMDIKIREIASKYLKQIEIKLSAQLSNYFKLKNYSVHDIKNANFINYHVILSMQDDFIENKKKWIEEFASFDFSTIEEFVSKMSFGEKITALNWIDKSDIVDFFGISTNIDYIKKLITLKKYRNYIAHHQVVIPPIHRGSNIANFLKTISKYHSETISVEILKTLDICLSNRKLEKLLFSLKKHLNLNL